MTIIPDRSDWCLPVVLGRAVEQFGDRPFLSFRIGDRRLTFAEAGERAAAVAGGLASLGVGAGDRVLIMMANREEFVLTWFGANLLGACQVPVNIEYRGDFLEHLANTAEAAVIVVDAERLPAVVESVPRLPHLRHIVLVDADGDPEAVPGLTVTPYEALLASAPATPAAVRPHDLAAIHFTSGTTGRSKGAMMTHAHQHLLAEQNTTLVDLGPDDVYMTSLPLFHVNAQLTAVYAAMLVGARVHLEPKFSASRWLDIARETRATVTTTLGVMMPFLLAQPERPDDADNDLRCIWAVPCPPEQAKIFGERFGIERFVMPYGNTEIGVVTDPRVVPPAGSCGRPDERFFEVRLVDPETDEPVPPGTPGEVVVRPKVPWIITTGYFGMPERTVEAYRNLWFHTGDSLMQDEDGWLWFVDRIKDRIRRRGENVASADVELALLEHPAVVEAAVIAVPSELPGGEDELKACLVLSDADASLDELMAFAEQRLPRFAVPRYFEVLDELPKTPTAKVRKEVLRAAGVTERTVDRLASTAGGS
jgi:crotonobetaine/carnitine-CoA ligase